MSLTKTLGQFVADLSPNRVPEEAARIARLGFVDCIGTMIAGRREDCVRIMKEVLAPADGPATLTFGPQKSTAPEAAWINGTAAHALDYDDVGLRGHPSTVLVPAILAEAETLDSTGADMIVAYVAANHGQGKTVMDRGLGFLDGKAPARILLEDFQEADVV